MNYYDIEDVAEILNIGEDLIREWALRLDFPRDEKGRYLYSEKEIEALKNRPKRRNSK